MHYIIRHLTRFRYSAPVTESMMEIRMQPRSDAGQRCVSFRLQTVPRALASSHRDHNGNIVHHFDIPPRHTQITVTAEALVEVGVPPPPDAAAGWDALATSLPLDVLDALVPSHYARPTRLLAALTDAVWPTRPATPLQALRDLNHAMAREFAYAPQSTHVDSPIDDALHSRRGVCQDFAHIFIAAARSIGIPCRYVSGYLFHRREDHDRSAADATHAWAEAWLPGVGWHGFDPTNDIEAGVRHIRVAVGRDYADVPPTRGVFRGIADEILDVVVRVQPTSAPAEPEPAEAASPPWLEPVVAADDLAALQQQQQQQQ